MRKLFVLVGMMFLLVSLSHAQDYRVSGTAINPDEDDGTDIQVLKELPSDVGIGEVIQIMRPKEQEKPPQAPIEEKEIPVEIPTTITEEPEPEAPPSVETKEIPPKEESIVKKEPKTERSSASKKSSASTGKKSSSSRTSSSRKRVKRKKSWNRGRIKKMKRKRPLGRRATCPRF